MKLFSLSSMILAAALAPSAIHAQNANLTVLHGVPGLSAPVDVFANGSQLFSFDYGDQQGPLSLPSGAYNIDVQLNGSSILNAAVTLQASMDYSAIAHLDAMGSPTISLFTNDISNLALPSSRLTVRHTAQAPAVDVAVDQNGSRIATFPNVTNGNEVAADVAPGDYAASLFVAGTQTRAFGPVDLALENGYSYIVYAVGDVSAPNFRLLVQRIDLAARVTVIHGIPGLPAPVDVSANGTRLFSFDYGESAGPLVLNAGSYALAVSLNGMPVLQTTANLTNGVNATVIAHLDATGANTLATFINDVTPLATGARLTVRHTAQAPAVDVGLDDVTGMRVATLSNLTNGMSTTAPVPSNLFRASLLVAGTTNVAFGPADLFISSGIHYLVYAIGDVSAPNFQLFVQKIDLSGGVPGDLSASNGGTSCGPQIQASSPTIDYGEHFLVQVTGGTANGMAMLNVGDSLSSQGNVALPFDLTPLGASGCSVWTNSVATAPLALDAQGDASVNLLVPNAAFGTFPTIYFQGFTTTGANALGVLATDYLQLQ